MIESKKKLSKVDLVQDISDGVCAYVAGGFGNQLFILAAGLEQSSRLGVPLYLDNSHFIADNYRIFESQLVFPNAIPLGSKSPWTTFKVGSRSVPFPKRISTLKNTYFEKNHAKYESSINRIIPGTTLFGYFQSAQYFTSVADVISDSLNNQLVTSEEQELILRSKEDQRITVHLRRGDYLDLQQLVTSRQYLERSLNTLDRMGIEPKLRVFSDSPNLVRNELSGMDADIEYVPLNPNISSVATVRAMAEGSSFVMSNSSFSWWAAWHMSQNCKWEKPVIAPRPWTLDGNSRADLIMPNWLTLDAR